MEIVKIGLQGYLLPWHLRQVTTLNRKVYEQKRKSGSASLMPQDLIIFFKKKSCIFSLLHGVVSAGDLEEIQQVNFKKNAAFLKEGKISSPST